MIVAGGVPLKGDVYHPTLGRAVIATAEHLGGFIAKQEETP